MNEPENKCKEMKETSFKILFWGSWLAAFIFLAPFLYAYAFCILIGDDFDEITKAMCVLDFPGAIYEMGREWLTWSGRYIYHFLAVLFSHFTINPWSRGFLYIIPVIIFGFSVSMLARLVSVFPPFLFGILAIIALYVNFSHLWVFYNFMDVFSSVLQWSAYFIFFISSLYFIQRHKCRKAYLWCVTSGMAAIGLYETSALTTIWTYIAIWLIIRKKNFEYRNGKISAGREALPSIIFLRHWWNRLGLWLIISFVVSFLAPGNFSRTQMRHIPLEQKLQNIMSIPSLWYESHLQFFSSHWHWQIFCLGGLLAFFGKASSKRLSIYEMLVVLVVWLLFSFSLFLLLSLTDAPFNSSPKFRDLLYLPLSLITGIFFYTLFLMVCNKDFVQHHKFLGVIFFITLFFWGIASSVNFQRTALNAANGEFLRLRNFMVMREDFLKQAAQGNSSVEAWPEFGILGEFRDPDARKVRNRPLLKEITLDSWQKSVFPVYMGSIFSRNSSEWPNPRASWFYGVGSIAENPVNPARAFKRAAYDDGIELAVPSYFKNFGIEQIRLIFAPGNMDSSILWMILQCNKDFQKKLTVWLPSPVTWKRLLPVPLQEWTLKKVVERKTFHKDLLSDLSGTEEFLLFAKNGDGIYAAPIPGFNREYPQILYISINGKKFERLKPFL